jgi:putative transcriptional regulator
MSEDLQAGDLLVSPPSIIDSRFEKTVLFLTHHGEVGSLALCVNRPTDHKINDILKELDLKLDKNFPLYWGGPVNSSTIWMLHSNEWHIDTTIPINDHWSLTSHISMFHHLSDSDEPKKFRVFFGQASWGPGQLMGELEGDPPWSKNHSWLTVKNPNPSWMMDTNAKNLWIEATQICGEQAVEKWLI